MTFSNSTEGRLLVVVRCISVLFVAMLGLGMRSAVAGPATLPTTRPTWMSISVAGERPSVDEVLRTFSYAKEHDVNYVILLVNTSNWSQNDTERLGDALMLPHNCQLIAFVKCDDGAARELVSQCDRTILHADSELAHLNTSNTYPRSMEDLQKLLGVAAWDKVDVPAPDPVALQPMATGSGRSIVIADAAETESKRRDRLLGISQRLQTRPPAIRASLERLQVDMQPITDAIDRLDSDIRRTQAKVDDAQAACTRGIHRAFEAYLEDVRSGRKTPSRGNSGTREAAYLTYLDKCATLRRDASRDCTQLYADLKVLGEEMAKRKAQLSPLQSQFDRLLWKDADAAPVPVPVVAPLSVQKS